MLVLITGAVVFLAVESEVAELAFSGDIKELREPLRPIRGETRVLLFGLDGVGAPVLYESIRSGGMPAVSSLLGAPTDSSGLWVHGYGARDVLSVLPAETTAGWTAVLTGARPAESGVAGNEWFVRDSLAFYAPVPLSVHSYAHTLRIYTDGLIGDQIRVPTLFERVDDLRSHVALGFVSRGADLLSPPNFSQLSRLLENLLDAALGREEVGAELYRSLDYSTVIGVREAAEEHGLPDLQFAYFPGIDLLTHSSDSSLERQRSYLSEVVDPAIDEVISLYRSRGVLDRTYVLFVADHGHTPHLKDDAHALDDEPLALLDSLGLRVREPDTERDDSARYDAVFAANEAFAYVYLADRSTCPTENDLCDWRRPPRLINDLLPVAKGLYAATESGAYAPSLAGTFDLIFVRDPGRSPAEYQVFDGASLVSLESYLAHNPREDLALLKERLSWLTDGPQGDHAGDIAVLARGGADRPLEERYYFALPHFSGHGSAHVQDGAIPLLLAQTRTSGETLRDLLHEIAGAAPTQLSVTPLVEGLLERNLLTASPTR